MRIYISTACILAVIAIAVVSIVLLSRSFTTPPSADSYPRIGIYYSKEVDDPVSLSRWDAVVIQTALPQYAALDRLKYGNPYIAVFTTAPNLSPTASPKSSEVKILNYNNNDSTKDGTYIASYTTVYGQNSYREVRLYLGTALLGDGYFAFSNPDHTSTWWYDEYSVDFQTGQATGDASRKRYLGKPTDAPKKYSNGIYERTFEKGIVLVNPTNETIYFPLGVKYRKIKGTQDPLINDGSTITEATIPSQDAIILLKVATP